MADRAQNAMKTPAAVARAPGADFSIEELDVTGPRPGEVLVEIAGVGLCHTDLVFRDQFVPYPLPAVLGHEGAGTVRAVGPGVDRLQIGDTVVLGFSSCGKCANCEASLPSYCQDFPTRNYAGARSDGSTAYVSGGESVASHFFGQSSFARLAIAEARNAVKVDARGLDLSILGTLGCGFQTGAGSVLRSFDCHKGASLVVIGAGPVGLAAVMAAAYRGCEPIIVIEPFDRRRAIALELGATHALDPAQGDLAELVWAICPTGVEFVLEASGNEAAIVAGLAMLASHGTLGLVGVPRNAEVTLPVNVAGMITFGHRVIGIIEGDSDLYSFIPELLEMHRSGAFAFDRLVTTFPMTEINRAIAAQASGECIKAVLLP